MVSLRLFKKLKVVLDFKNFIVCLEKFNIGIKSFEVGDDILGSVGQESCIEEEEFEDLKSLQDLNRRRKKGKGIS